MDTKLEQARTLKQALIEFVLEAEGELAESLESYVALKSKTLENRYDATYQRNLLIDTFITEGDVAGKTPLELFISSHSQQLSPKDCTLLQGWHHSIMGLFAVQEKLIDGFRLMNWLTSKEYIVKPNDPITLEEMARFKEGEILLTRIAPVKDYFMFSGPCIPMGRLGKPKLAVAIGNFKKDHKEHLYSDAPELLEEAWQSVEKYHDEFINFFGTDEVTLPGQELNDKIAELQEIMRKKLLVAAGIDESKSLEEIAEEAGVTEDEMKEAAKEAGAKEEDISNLFQNKGSKAKMVMPKVDLPNELKKADELTALTHPRWGQMFLPTYTQFKNLLKADDWQSVDNANKLVRQYLEEPTITAFIWHRLAQEYPIQLETVLREVLERPDFQLDTDLDAVLQEYDKTLEPDLPEIASVPVHLHNLFQEAFTEVSKPKKGKKKPKAKGGFQ